MDTVETTGPQAPKSDREPGDTTSLIAGLGSPVETAAAATQADLTDTSAEDLGLTLARAPSTAVPESSAPDPLTVLLNHLTILGPAERAFPSSFLPPQGVAATMPGHETTLAPLSAHRALGATSERNLDLAGALRGAPLTQDLTSIDKVLGHLRQTQDAQGVGRSSHPITEVVGQVGQPTQGHGAGKIDVGDIVKPKDLLPPSGN
ncbi:MAG TPA: hypothetical protein VLA85_10960 [Verrucomicrobiae bacterium]|nr:hypothetical protein [Verrucomicrobiae bacterium]